MKLSHHLRTDELTDDFIEYLKIVFKDKHINIVVRDEDFEEEDETAYLLKNPANRARLLEAIDNVKNKRNLVEVDPSIFK